MTGNGGQSSRTGWRLPVVSSQAEMDIPWATLETMIGGRSVVDLQRLPLESRAEALAFLRSYGFDPDLPDDVRAMEIIRGHALAYLNQVLLPYAGVAAVPPHYAAMPLEQLLMQAAAPRRGDWPNWPCVLLKLLHCVTHALYTHDTEAHAEAVVQVRQRFAAYLAEENGQLWFGDERCRVPLVAFQVKEEKTFARTLTKLLHKPGNLALNIYDRLGVRLVTYDIFSAVLLIRFLINRNVIMYANNMPERSRNSLAELAEIHQLYGHTPTPFRVVDLPEGPAHPSLTPETEAAFNLIEENPFTHRAFKMIKLTERIMVKLARGRRTFVPYEIQILDRHAWDAMQEGAGAHDAYEERQLARVRQRVFGRPPATEDVR